jgi:DNA-binding MarR family transcriptional regulator
MLVARSLLHRARDVGAASCRGLTDTFGVYTLIVMKTKRERELCLSVAQDCTAFNLRKALRAVSHIYEEALAPSGLRDTQLSLLVALALGGDMPVARLAGMLVLDRTTLTRNLRPLERQGLVRSAPGPDRRVRLVRLTEAGRAALTLALPAWEKAHRRVMAGLGQRRWQALTDALRASAGLG